MKSEYQPIITGQTRLLGFLASPASQSLSPRMHNLAIAKLGLDYAYLGFDIDNDSLGDAIVGMKALSARGFNVSMPNKMKVIDYLDEVSESVKLIGACNTVINDNGRLRGENTDSLGFIKALDQHGVGYRGNKVVVIGIGGVAMAMIVQLALSGAGSIDVFNRKDDFFAKGQQKAREISEHTGVPVSMHDLDDYQELAASLKESVALVNGTSVGFKGKLEHLSPLPDPGLLRPDIFVADAVYEPLKSKLLEQAEKADCQYMNGIPLLLFQGEVAFKWWTGEEMPMDYVSKHLFHQE